MSINIELDLDEILTRLDQIILTNEFESLEITERLDILEQIIQANAANATLFSFWTITLMAFTAALILAAIFALVWRR